MPRSPESEPSQPDWQRYLAAYQRAWQTVQDNPTPANLAVLRTGEEILIRELLKPGRFPLGQLVMTPGADEAMTEAGHIPPEFLLRHKNADWGELDEFDKQQNDLALLHGSRLLSAYHTRLAAKLWVITEADRSATTLLLPDEY